MTDGQLGSSFRDPSGVIFSHEGTIYRQVNSCYQEDYDLLKNSGLYDELVESGALIAHEEVDLDFRLSDVAYRILKPRYIPFISYPYEWCFSQLKDAALLTLSIERRALERGMTLKDCSAYNVQFDRGRPIFIDTLSFEGYVEGEPWVAYRQFCQHFLAPLALMSRVDVRLSQLMRVYIDGIPLDLASALLPRRTWGNFRLALHIHAHAKAQGRYADAGADGESVPQPRRKVGRLARIGMIDSLENAVRGMRWKPAGTTWGDYYSATNYTDDAFEHKRKLVDEYLGQLSPATVWDLGANTGEFSRVAAERGISTVSFDIDPAAVELNYLREEDEAKANVLPLLLDLTNPSPGLGWDNDERMDVPQRGPADVVMGLALVHHLAIGNNVPLEHVADYFAKLAPHLIIEFVPKSDSQIKRLLATREDIFSDYTEAGFERAFASRFRIVRSEPVHESERTLYLMERLSASDNASVADRLGKTGSVPGSTAAQSQGAKGE